MIKETEREEIKEEAHELEDAEKDELEEDDDVDEDDDADNSQKDKIYKKLKVSFSCTHRE